MPIYDTHAHLNSPRFDGDLADVVERARKAGVQCILCPGVDVPSSHRAVALAGEFPGLVVAAVGIHPTSWQDATEEDMGTIEELACRPEVAAIGETGLDLHHQPSALKAQSEGFRRHIALARATGKPLVMHARKADEEVLQVLREEGVEGLRGVRHCFDRSLETARAYLDLDFYVSLAAHLTRPGYKRLKAAARRLPAERLLVETDSPYQAPYSKKGQRNEPAFIVETLEAAAGLRGRPAGEVGETTTRNAERLFGKPPVPG